MIYNTFQIVIEKKYIKFDYECMFNNIIIYLGEISRKAHGKGPKCCNKPPIMIEGLNSGSFIG